MNAVFQLTECCRICLRIENTLTSFNVEDTDNIKLCDKLAAFISDIEWFKPGASTVLCANCIEKLRNAYDFRLLCIQSENESQQIYTNLDDYTLPESTTIQDEVIVPYKTIYMNVKQIVDEGTSENVHKKVASTRSVKTQTQALPQYPTLTPAAARLEAMNKTKVMVLGEIQKFNCQVCGKQYAKNANLKIHMRTHTGEKPFECKYCEKKFYHSSHLREHIRRHTGEKPFQCHVCMKRFTITAELTVHMRIHTGEKPYACTLCDKRYIKMSDLQVHLRSHTGEKPFSCNICAKKFASGYILNSHLRTHTNERPWECTVCKKRFIQSSHLAVHSRKHTEKTMEDSRKKFLCLPCNRQFTSLNGLQEHVKVHAGENMLMCNICDRTFATNRSLEKHVETHLHEKPFSCDLCAKKYTQESSFKAHLKKHTEEKPYTCNICTRRFASCTYLSVHLREHKKYTVQ